MGTRTGRPTGRPTKLDRVIDRRLAPDGRSTIPITTADRIVELIRIGAYIETAAAAAGVHRRTLLLWLQDGAEAATALATGASRSSLTRYQRLAADFSRAVATARAEADAAADARIETHARGGFERRIVTTRRDASGAVLEVSERVETLPPNPQVEMWRYERKNGRAADRVEVSGPDGGPVEVSIEEERELVLEELAEVAARMAESRPVEIVDAEIVDED